MRRLLLLLLPLADILLLPLVYPAALLLKNIRKAGVHRMPLARRALLQVGMFPIRDHYYDPQFDFRAPHAPFDAPRDLPAVDLAHQRQLDWLAGMTYAAELSDIPREKPATLGFHFNNRSFEGGDAEIWYQTIRMLKPRRIIEIGSGNSTLMAMRALAANRAEDAAYTCRHICIEPYEMGWLEQSGVEVLRQKVEEVDLAFFAQLEAGDILFIDSSHIIRPQGDVLFEYLEVLPRLKSGVVVHVHDIFTPRNYPEDWLAGEVRLWNEQYLLEAFLCDNREWEVLAALNFLFHESRPQLTAAAPYLDPAVEPRSFYMRRR